MTLHPKVSGGPVRPTTLNTSVTNGIEKTTAPSPTASGRTALGATITSGGSTKIRNGRLSTKTSPFLTPASTPGTPPLQSPSAAINGLKPFGNEIQSKVVDKVKFSPKRIPNDHSNSRLKYSSVGKVNVKRDINEQIGFANCDIKEKKAKNNKEARENGEEITVSKTACESTSTKRKKSTGSLNECNNKSKKKNIEENARLSENAKDENLCQVAPGSKRRNRNRKNKSKSNSAKYNTAAELNQADLSKNNGLSTANEINASNETNNSCGNQKNGKPKSKKRSHGTMINDSNSHKSELKCLKTKKLTENLTSTCTSPVIEDDNHNKAAVHLQAQDDRSVDTMTNNVITSEHCNGKDSVTVDVSDDNGNTTTMTQTNATTTPAAANSCPAHCNTNEVASKGGVSQDSESPQRKENGSRLTPDVQSNGCSNNFNEKCDDKNVNTTGSTHASKFAICEIVNANVAMDDESESPFSNNVDASLLEREPIENISLHNCEELELSWDFERSQFMIQTNKSNSCECILSAMETNNCIYTTFDDASNCKNFLRKVKSSTEIENIECNNNYCFDESRENWFECSISRANSHDSLYNSRANDKFSKHTESMKDELPEILVTLESQDTTENIGDKNIEEQHSCGNEEFIRYVFEMSLAEVTGSKPPSFVVISPEHLTADQHPRRDSATTEPPMSDGHQHDRNPKLEGPPGADNCNLQQKNDLRYILEKDGDNVTIAQQTIRDFSEMKVNGKASGDSVMTGENDDLLQKSCERNFSPTSTTTVEMKGSYILKKGAPHLDDLCTPYSDVGPVNYSSNNSVLTADEGIEYNCEIFSCEDIKLHKQDAEIDEVICNLSYLTAEEPQLEPSNATQTVEQTTSFTSSVTRATAEDLDLTILNKQVQNLNAGILPDGILDEAKLPKIACDEAFIMTNGNQSASDNTMEDISQIEGCLDRKQLTAEVDRTPLNCVMKASEEVQLDKKLDNEGNANIVSAAVELQHEVTATHSLNAPTPFVVDSVGANELSKGFEGQSENVDYATASPIKDDSGVGCLAASVGNAVDAQLTEGTSADAGDAKIAAAAVNEAIDAVIECVSSKTSFTIFKESVDTDDLCSDKERMLIDSGISVDDATVGVLQAVSDAAHAVHCNSVDGLNSFNDQSHGVTEQLKQCGSADALPNLAINPCSVVNDTTCNDSVNCSSKEISRRTSKPNLSSKNESNLKLIVKSKELKGECKETRSKIMKQRSVERPLKSTRLKALSKSTPKINNVSKLTSPSMSLQCKASCATSRSNTPSDSLHACAGKAKGEVTASIQTTGPSNSLASSAEKSNKGVVNYIATNLVPSDSMSKRAGKPNGVMNSAVSTPGNRMHTERPSRRSSTPTPPATLKPVKRKLTVADCAEKKKTPGPSHRVSGS